MASSRFNNEAPHHVQIQNSTRGLNESSQIIGSNDIGYSHYNQSNYSHQYGPQHVELFHPSFISSPSANLSYMLPWQYSEKYLLYGNRSNEFSIICYNVLSQTILKNHMMLYSKCNPTHLEWAYRWDLLQNTFQIMNADVFCLQEVQQDHYVSHFLPFFSYLGYKGLYKKRTGEQIDGCAIFYRESVFQLIEYSDVEYKQNDFLDRDNIGLVCIFNHLRSNQNVCIATTHLLFNPKRTNIKLAQMMIFLSEIERLSYVGNDRYCPVIMTGDLNSEPNSPVINLIEKGFLDSPHSIEQVGISASAQHKSVLTLRSTFSSNPVSRKEIRQKENDVIILNNTGKPRKINIEKSSRSESVMEHQFCFESAYQYIDSYGGKEVSSMAGSRLKNVDYIFYSKVRFIK